MNKVEQELNDSVSWIETITEDVRAGSDNLSKARQVFAREWINQNSITDMGTLPQLILLKQTSREWLGEPEKRRFDSTTMLALGVLRQMPEILETADGFILPGQLAIAIEHSLPMHMEVRLQNLARQSIEASKAILQ